MATKIVTKNSSTASAVPTAAQLVQGELAVNVADKRLYTEDNAGAVVELGTNPSTLTVTGEITANGGIALGDNDKATFGAGDDLEIYHDGSNSYISDVGTGNLNIQGNNLILEDPNGINFLGGNGSTGAVTLYSSGAARLATTSTGIDVTGTVTADGFQTDIANTTTNLLARNSSNAAVYLQNGGTGDVLHVRSGNMSAGQGDLHLKVANNGDISFYEDTGTTPKFFWDASAERLGLGTTSPQRPFHLHIGTDNTAARFQSTDTEVALEFIDLAGTAYFRASGDYIKMGATQSDSLTILNGGNVGIGTSSPVGLLNLEASSGNSQLYITTNDTTSKSQLIFGDSADSNVGGVQYNHSDDSMQFHSGNGGERMRIDASGNLLVGKTSANNTTAGTTIYGAIAKGAASFVRDAGNTLILNRLTDDGEILAFRKDGVGVGSIGTVGGLLGVGSGVSNLQFESSSTAISPSSTTSGGASDGALDLGKGNRRFKDAYLSGGVYLGGTGDANKLDDYEEGTWTPALGGGATATGMTGTYTKVGRLVTAHLHLENSTISGTPDYIVSGLPFTSINSRTPFAVTYFKTFNTTCESLGGFVAGNTDTMQFLGMIQGSPWATAPLTAGTGRYAFATAVYQTA